MGREEISPKKLFYILLLVSTVILWFTVRDISYFVVHKQLYLHLGKGFDDVVLQAPEAILYIGFQIVLIIIFGFIMKHIREKY